jgi:hypothetical protein
MAKTITTDNGKITITTDHKWKNVISWWDLTEKQQADFDWLDDEEKQACASFVKRRGHVYCLDEISAAYANGPLAADGWDGVASDSFFSGIVIKLSNDGEQYKIGYYVCH